MYHVSRLIERLKSIYNRTLKWRVYFWEHVLKILTSLTQNWVKKDPNLLFHVPKVIERWNSIVKGNLMWSIRFRNHCLKLLKFWLPLTSSTQKWVRKVQVGISCTNVDRKTKIKGKRYFEMNYSFMKPFSQKFEVLTQCAIWWRHQPKIGSKRTQTHISCSIRDKGWRSKVKEL